jgi:glucokinase
MIERSFADRNIFFIHDSTAFILGEICNNSYLATQNIAGVMLGTGLGYVHCIRGKVEINQKKTPLNPLWNRPYKDGIAENYVSATAIINKAAAKGYSFDGVKEIATKAKQGDYQLLKIFSEAGEHLGKLLQTKQKEDRFESLVIGGQVSRSWDLMRESFENTCSIPYHVVEEPGKCSLFGIKYCAENGVENIYTLGE